MRLRYSSFPPISDRCRPSIASPPNSQYLGPKYQAYIRYNAKANALGGPPKQERNPKPQDDRMRTVATNTIAHHHQPATQGQLFDSTHSKGDVNNTQGRF